MRLKMIILSLLCVTCLAGCSNSGGASSLSLKGNVIYNGKDATGVTEHRGTTAKTVMNGIGETEYYLCNTTDACSHNSADILEEDMTPYKKGLYYSRYLGTEVTVYHKYGKEFIESRTLLDDVDKMSVEAAVDKAYAESDNLKLGNTFKTVNFEDKMTINVEGREFVVRTNEIVIPGLLRVKYDDGTVKCDQHITIGDKSLSKTSTSKYDYYQYGGALIQAAIGTDISSLITFK